MADKKIKDIAVNMASKPGVDMAEIASVYDVHPTQVANLLAREIRNGDWMGLNREQLQILSKNVGDKTLEKVVQHQLGKESGAHAESRTENKMSRSPKQLADSLEALHKRLADRILKGKPKSKLISGKKTKMPGFSTYFRKDV